MSVTVCPIGTIWHSDPRTRSAVKITNRNPEPTLFTHLETLCSCVINYQYNRASRDCGLTW